MPRWSLAAVSVVHALAFGWAAVALPWQRFTLFSLASLALALLHVFVAVLAGARHDLLAKAWRIQCFASLVYLGLLTWGLGSSAVYLYSLYASLGPGMAAALLVALTPVVLFTLPLACWGLAATGGFSRKSRIGRAALGLLVLAAGEITFAWARGASANVPAPVSSSTDLAQALEQMLPKRTASRDEEPSKARSLYTVAPAECAEPIDNARATLVVTYVADKKKRPVTKCLQAEPAALLQTLRGHLEKAGAHGPLKIDLVTRTGKIRGPFALTRALSVRPGIDGVCQERTCLMPWQLVALDSFVSNQPIPALADIRFGVDEDALRRALGVSEGRLTRIETLSAIVHSDESVHQNPPPSTKLGAKELARASGSAERFIRQSQNETGLFGYLVNPFTGKRPKAALSLARQAGTTAAWCEHAHAEDKAEVAARALALLAGNETRFGDKSVLVSSPRGPRARLGQTALPLIAFLFCRPLVGSEHDALIGRLARLLIAQQRGDGGFHHEVDLASGDPVPGPATLFADGEVVLGLVLLEALGDGASAHFPPVVETRAAVERAMTYFGTRYFDVFARQFFFIAENWHCLAAQAALPHHRSDAYERFCLDYTAFRNRFVFDAESGVRAEYIGGHSVGNLVPPHTTSAAGHGETLAAAIAIKRARGLSVDDDLRTLGSVLSFLVRSQWTEATCFACRPDAGIPGGFSEHAASPMIRIDYVQHAWAALATGERELFPSGDGE